MTGRALSAREILALEDLGGDRFRGLHNQDNYLGAVFGGQFLGQALAAAQRTVPDWPVHHSSGQFLRSGDTAVPLDFAVERVRDGRRFAARRVLVSQAGRTVFDTLCSFHAPEDGAAHQCTDMPRSDPDSLPDLQAFARANGHRLSPGMAAVYASDFPVELRLVDADSAMFGADPPPRRDFWFRMPSAAAIDDPRDHHALIAFMSDYWFASVAGAGHGGRASFFASLNHGLWVHAPVRVDQWLLMRAESPWGGAGRGLARGFIHDRAGMLVASAVQEVGMRFDAPG